MSDFDDTVADILNCEDVFQGWIYAGPQEAKSLGQPIVTRPYSARIFGLPKTHQIYHSHTDDDTHVDFLVWCIGFFLGIPQSIAITSHLDGAPVKARKLTDFLLHFSEYPEAMDRIESFWQSYKSEPLVPKRVTAVINSLFMSSYPQLLDFEQFNLLYMSLDSCFAIVKELHAAPKGHLTHAGRIKWMCEVHGVPLPQWAEISSGSSEISLIRNDTLHEALFCGEPLGYAIYDNNTTSGGYKNVLLEMRSLICRILVATLFSPTSSYVQTTTHSRQIYRLKLL